MYPRTLVSPEFLSWRISLFFFRSGLRASLSIMICFGFASIRWSVKLVEADDTLHYVYRYVHPKVDCCNGIWRIRSSISLFHFQKFQQKKKKKKRRKKDIEGECNLQLLMNLSIPDMQGKWAVFVFVAVKQNVVVLYRMLLFLRTLFLRT